MVRSSLFVLCIGLLCLSPLGVMTVDAAARSFEIDLQVGVDTLAPSVPTTTNAVPISDSQIDISWLAATDNVGVAGYQVFRDLTKIATTTLTSYSDISLTGSTTYSYTVVAFDGERNFSSSSLPIATTTLSTSTATPTTTTTNPSSGRSLIGVIPQVEVLTITAGRTDVRFDWQTNRGVGYELRWGQVVSAPDGIVSSNGIARDHTTVLRDLLPGTRYEYELFAVDARGRKTLIDTGTFTTDAASDRVAPPNVSGLQAERVGTGVRLSWQNPDVPDLATVQVVRSHLFYPTDKSNGFSLYRGLNDSVFDRRAFQYGERAYYTVFAIDTAGNVSSGAIVSVRQPDDGPTAGEPPAPELQRPVTTATSGPGSATTSPRTPVLTVGAVRITQGTTTYTLADPTAEVASDQPITIAIAFEAVPQHLKSLVVTLTHPHEETTASFLLRINQDRSAYEATVAPLRFTGDMPLVVDIFDFRLQTVSRVTGTLSVVRSGKWSSAVGLPWYQTWPYQVSFALFLLLLVLLYVRWRIGRAATPA